MWKLFFDALKTAKAQKKQEKELKRFLNIGGVDYVALQNMVNSVAYHGVTFRITMPNQTIIEIKRDDVLDTAKAHLDRELY